MNVRVIVMRKHTNRHTHTQPERDEMVHTYSHMCAHAFLTFTYYMCRHSLFNTESETRTRIAMVFHTARTAFAGNSFARARALAHIHTHTPAIAFE